MPKITFIGAGSTVFARNVLGDVMLTESLREAEIALYDIDAARLRQSKRVLDALNAGINRGRARIRVYGGVAQRRAALKNADFVVNAIQVGGYKPATVIDFEVPKKYGLRQTIGDTMGIGGIFRGLRTIPVMLDIARDVEAVCPAAWFLNYTNPMSIISGAMLRATALNYVGLCHSVQVLVEHCLGSVGMGANLAQVHENMVGVRWKAAGINHMCWLLELRRQGRDLYPEVRRRGARVLRQALAKRLGGAHGDLVRLELMRTFGYYVSESSVHSAEYFPYWIKSAHPELLKDYEIPLDEYPRRCVQLIEKWKTASRESLARPRLQHTRTEEYASRIMEAIVSDKPVRVHGNVLNAGLITNLPSSAVVEVPCLVDANGVQGCRVGDLPETCAALNRAALNVHLLTVEAALTLRRDAVYQAALLDPHTAAELTIDQVRDMCDEMIAAHGKYLPDYR